MSKFPKLGALLLCLSMTVPVLASTPAQPPKKNSKHHGKLIPARHNAGRPTHG
ncbi:MAG TPA: hypothetical protein VGL89_04370 [Candidatus Koribacter sp.]|jgi:hypothetical protein